MNRRALITATVAAALVAVAAPAYAAPIKPRVAKAVASAEGAGAVATATATCPESGGNKGPWRALSGGFRMTTYTSTPSGDQNTPVIPYGSGVIHEFRRVGSRSWRVSAQSLWGRVDLKALVNCQRGVPKPRAISAKVATPGADQLGPALTAQCPSGRAVSGGFVTPAPFAAGEAANTVTDLFPVGTRAWKLRVVSNQPSSVTALSYCAERRRKPKVATSVGTAAEESRTTADTEAHSTGQFCPGKRFAPGGGGFRQEGATASQYFLPVVVYQGPAFESDPRTPVSGYFGNNWHASGLKVGTGTSVRLRSASLCG